MITSLKKYRYRDKTKDGQAIFKFPNGYGASVVRNKFSYGGSNGLFELAVIFWDTDNTWDIDYSTSITDDVIGYLSHDEVLEILYNIIKLPEKEKCITESHKVLTCDAKTP